MKEFCRVKLIGSEDRYLGETLIDVERQEAPIEKYDAAVARAQKRFGRDAWMNFATIEEVDNYSEVMAWKGRRGGRKMTAKRREVLSDELPNRLPKKVFTYKEWVVCARSVQRARDLLEKAGKNYSFWWIYRGFTKRKTFPAPLKRKVLAEGVWRLTNGEWRKVL